MLKPLKWYDLRQHALMSKAEQMRGEDAHWRWYMRMLVAGRRPDRKTTVFNGWNGKGELVWSSSRSSWR